MSAFCCWSCGEEFDEYSRPSDSIYRHCLGLRYFFHLLLCGYTALFNRLEERPIVSPYQRSISSSTELSTAHESSRSGTYLSIPRPTPFDPDQRLSRSQRDGLVFRRDKSMSNFQEESQPLRRNVSCSGMEPLAPGKRQIKVDFEDEYRAGSSEAFVKNFSAKYTQPPSEDEDVCPTCLEEYTLENPRIVTKCSHHFHLGCIYEWLERSETCPICGRDMEFCESS